MNPRFSVLNFSIILALVLSLLIFHLSSAQGPQIFITWSTEGYAPPWYAGKILPTSRSHIKARVAVLGPSSFMDLSQEQINWYVNGVPIQSGVGIQTVEFDVPTQTQPSLDLKAQLISLEGGPYSKSIRVPIVKPEAVIEARYPGGTISGQKNIFVAALPFFFRAQSASELNFSWQVNGETPANLTDPERLNIKSAAGFGSGSEVLVSLAIQNGNESAFRSKTFTSQ